MTIRLLAAASVALLVSLALAVVVAWPLPPSLGVPLLIGLLGILVLGLLWARFVLRPLGTLLKALARLESGDGKVRVEPCGVRELKAMAEHVNVLAERLEDRRREQLRFISNVVHDLRNPLHSITMASELLELKSPEDNGELVSAIFRQVSSLDALLSDLIDLSRIEAGELELRLCEEDVLALVRDVVERCRKGNDLHYFRIEASEKGIAARCDARRITHVLRSLLSNAVKYSPNGGEIRVEVRGNGDRAEIAVTDHGIGIPREELRNIFKPFYRLKSAGTPLPGKGMGLSTSRRIVEAHGGGIDVESRPGYGSTFRLTIPRTGPAAMGRRDVRANPLAVR